MSFGEGGDTENEKKEYRLMICSVSFGLHTLNPLNRLADADGAKTLANWLEEWVEDDLENDGPEFADTAHFDFVTSFERWIKPDMCTRHKCFHKVSTII